MKEKKQISVGIILSYIAQFMQIIITLFYTPIMLKLLGQSEYGIYQLVYSIVSYLSLLNFGFSSSYVKFYSECQVKKNAKEEENRINGIFLAVFFVLSVVVLLLGIFLVLNVEEVLGQKLTANEIKIARELMIIMVFNSVINFLTIVFDNYLIAREKFIGLQIVNVVSTIANPCLTFPLLLMGYKSKALGIALLSITIIKFVVYVVYCIKFLGMRFCFRNMQFRYVKSVASFSGFIFIESVVSMINISLDRVLLGNLVGSISVAIYSVGGQINTLYTSLSTSISSAFTPQINRMVSEKCEKRKISDLFIEVGRLQFLILFLILTGFIFFGKRFMLMWAGEEYMNAYYVAVILIVPNTINLIQNTAIEVQRAMGLQKYRSLTYLVIAILNIMVSIYFIGLWEECGAALGTCLAWILGSGFIMNWFYYKKVGLDILRFWLEIFKIIRGAIIPIIFGILIKEYALTCDLKQYVLLIIIYVMIYLITIYLFGLSNKEKGVIKSICAKLRVLKA